MLKTIKAWLSRPYMITSLILALVLVFGSLLVPSLNIARNLEDFTHYLQRSLSSVDTLKIANAFAYEFTGCEVVGEFPDYTTSCTGQGLTTPNMTFEERLDADPPKKLTERYATALINAVYRLWTDSTWFGLAIFIPAFWMSGVFVAKRLPAESEFLAFILWTFVTPLVASGVAFALKIFLLVLVWIFSAVLAGILWVLATFGWLLFWLGRGMEVVSTAQNIAEVRSNTTNGKPPGSSSGSN